MIFESTSVFHLSDEQKISQWLNEQHVGKKQIPFEEEAPEDLKKAHQTVRFGRAVTVYFKVNKEGEWTPDEIEFERKHYTLELK